MKTIKIKIICVCFYLILWLLLVISFLAPWYEERFKVDIFYKKEFEFNQFLINNKVVQFNKVDALDGENEYLREAFGFDIPNLERVIKTIKAFLSIGFILICFLAILTILFMIDVQFIPRDNNIKTLKELKYWKLFFTYGPLIPTLSLFISMISCLAIPNSVRIDCFNSLGIEKCNDQLRFHKSFKGENEAWEWGPSKGFNTLLSAVVVSILSSIFSIITSLKINKNLLE